MKLINNRWVDDNNNSWSANLDTEESAQRKSNTMRNCSNCSYCSDCSSCSNCSYCSDCSSCSNCTNCSSCSYCSNCSDCSSCSNCTNCSSCSNCTYCFDCTKCSNFTWCSSCSSCSDCSYCSGFKTNPQRITSERIGSRNSQTTYYWTEEHEQVVCGCFKGTLDEFEQRVKEVHGDNEHGIAYQKWIDKIKIYKN